MSETTTQPAGQPVGPRESARSWETAEYWTRHWLDDSAQTLEAWRVEGAGRPRTADRAEMAIRRPPCLPAGGPLRDDVVLRRRVARRWLEEADQQLAALVERRRRLVERIDACTLALAGTGRPPRGRGSLGSLGSDDSSPGESRPGESGPGEVSAHALRREAVALVLAADMPLDLSEIQRLLGLLGVTIAGRPSQTLSNALRPSVASGRLVRLQRGCYAPGSDDIGL